MLVIGLYDVDQVWNDGLDVFWDDFDWTEMVKLRKFVHLWTLLVAVLFQDHLWGLRFCVCWGFAGWLHAQLALCLVALLLGLRWVLREGTLCGDLLNRSGRPFLLLSRLQEPDLGGHGEIRQRAKYHNLIQLVLEVILLHRQRKLEIFNCRHVHMHNRPNVKLIHPTAGLTDAENWSFALVSGFNVGRDELLPYLLFIKLRVFLPVVKVKLFEGFVQEGQ